MARNTVQDSLRIDLANPAIRSITGADVMRCGTFTWGEGAAIGYCWRPLARVLELRFTIGGASVVQCVRIVESPARFGGARKWFECPTTRSRTRALFLPPGRDRWAGRIAHKLVYAVQQSRPGPWGRLARALDQADAHTRRNAVRCLRRRERSREAARR